MTHATRSHGVQLPGTVGAPPTRPSKRPAVVPALGSIRVAPPQQAIAAAVAVAGARRGDQLLLLWLQGAAGARDQGHTRRGGRWDAAGGVAATAAAAAVGRCRGGCDLWRVSEGGRGRGDGEGLLPGVQADVVGGEVAGNLRAEGGGRGEEGDGGKVSEFIESDECRAETLTSAAIIAGHPSCVSCKSMCHTYWGRLIRCK